MQHEDQVQDNANLPPSSQEAAESQKIENETAAVAPEIAAPTAQPPAPASPESPAAAGPHSETASSGSADSAEAPTQINPKTLPTSAFLAALGFPDDSYVTVDANGIITVANCGPDPDPEDPRALAILEKIDPARHKRNCGRTGATTEIGKAIASKNSTRHGCCSTTLILKDEREEDWLELLNMWLAQFNNPVEKTVLYTFVMKTAQSEWMRLRAQREYDFCIQIHSGPDVALWAPEEVKRYELAQRYLTAAERRFQREYKMLDHHYRTYCKPADPPKPRAAKPEPPPRPVPPPTRYYNLGTGESQDGKGNKRPAPPNYVPEPITPGVYGPDHPSNWRPKPQEGGKP